MAYSELIKNFEKVRGYMREFYVYGFKSRTGYDKKSLRSYDDEKRRVESWLGDYMGFRRTADGKSVFLSIDSRATRHNPLFQAWKTKSFTDGDMTLHFILFDLFASTGAMLSVAEITERIDREYFSLFDSPMLPDESTVRKKLREYVNEGLLRVHRRGRQLLYARNDDGIESVDSALLDFYSEVAPCGVIGSYLLDKSECDESLIAFKHHYITQAFDSDILGELLLAISQKRRVEMETVNTLTGVLSFNTPEVALNAEVLTNELGKATIGVSLSNPSLIDFADSGKYLKVGVYTDPLYSAGSMVLSETVDSAKLGSVDNGTYMLSKTLKIKDILEVCLSATTR